MPLADKIRPKILKEVIGQEHILGENKILNRMAKSKNIRSMIFYGPPGVGKTTVANIIANTANKKFYKLNATTASVKDIQLIIGELNTIENINGIVLYIDEIQNFNKKQQQSILEFMENGKITLIASTTENPYHYVYKAILSRALVFEFKPLLEKDILIGIKVAINKIEQDIGKKFIKCEEDAMCHIAKVCGGDFRKALNILETAILYTSKDENGDIFIDLKVIEECSGMKSFDYDRDGDSHYDILSAFQKSIRGSDPDASVHYLARLIKSGDLVSICRRLLVIASEDIGLAYPNAITMVKTCVDSAMQLGFPEARIPLAQATLLLATSPKSNSAYMAISKAINDLETKNIGEIPNYLKDAHYEGAKALERGKTYKYPHDYKNNYIKQQYLPETLKNEKYYIPGENKMENAIKSYLNKINI
ncbi:replication-associated recombination protein A [Hathewaya limosa]|uniref:ATPase n=1 Tax=Hathewaya limosa TaxID=1536 RepID=A0ABU0JPD0_HATLI|nr:replication-associated recombination protein A [Hathewaya limosa]AWZ48766.1 AAA family ATPase [Clostridiaceae bacterium 14S0207]MDQ0478942.1 putative ATPase [Hathewaya limosa]